MAAAAARREASMEDDTAAMARSQPELVAQPEGQDGEHSKDAQACATHAGGPAGMTNRIHLAYRVGVLARLL